MNLDKDFTPYQESFELKELGFDEPCICAFYQDGQTTDPFPTFVIIKDVTNSKIAFGTIKCTRPTYSQAFRWFREKYGLPSHIATYWQHDWNNYSYQYYFVQDKVEWNGIEHYKTYEEAELACLRKLIEIVKDKQQ